EPVAKYWPEFAQEGKDQITIRQLLAHQAGLCAIDEPLDAATLADLDRLAVILARQRPAWEPGRKQGYHGLTMGCYEIDLLRRLDAQHRSLGKFFQDEVARPLGIEFYIGLPQEIPEARVAEVKDFRPVQLLFHLNKIPWPFVMAVMTPGSLAERSFKNPK